MTQNTRIAFRVMREPQKFIDERVASASQRRRVYPLYPPPSLVPSREERCVPLLAVDKADKP